MHQHTPNSAIAGFPGLYATLSISLVDSTHANIIFTTLDNFTMGANGMANLNVNGTYTRRPSAFP